jgi:hypothetical protein
VRKTRLLKTDVMTTTSKKQKASVKTNTHTHIIILFPKIPPFSLLNLNET